MAVTFDVNSDTLWNRLYAFIGNEYGVAGLMGNIWAESGFKPDNMENIGSQFGWTDATYTEAVNNGTEDFMRLYPIPNSQGGTTNRPLGYGICQWTSVNRKQGLWNLKTQQGVSIADINMQIDWLEYELTNNYASTLAVLQTADDIKVPSDYVLEHFEHPSGWDDPAVQDLRASYGVEIYYHYAGSPPPPPTPTPKFKKLPIYMMLNYTPYIK